MTAAPVHRGVVAGRGLTSRAAAGAPPEPGEDPARERAHEAGERARVRERERATMISDPRAASAPKRLIPLAGVPAHEADRGQRHEHRELDLHGRDLHARRLADAEQVDRDEEGDEPDDQPHEERGRASV